MTDGFQKLLCELEDWGAEPRLALEESFIGDCDFYKSCLLKFKDELFLRDLRDAMLRGDKKEAIRAVHTMKGNADYLGLLPVMDAAVSVLADLRSDRISGAMPDLRELEDAFSKFKSILSDDQTC